MSTHKYIDRICLAGALFSLLLSLLFLNGQALGIQPASQVMGYEARLFDVSRVHSIDIVMDDWDGFLDTCENEEYSACAVVIDGEAYKNVGLRAKGNTSLSTVSSLGSDRYSFKLEFDHYDSGKTYYGLDKLCLNNLIQDNTMMKDYLTYRLMAQFGANAPLCSFVYITVNGQDWGLYLAVEGLEESFLQRNYGQDYGALYKPDSLSFGGGRGNGRDFNMEDFMDRDRQAQTGAESSSGAMQPPGGQSPGMQPPDSQGAAPAPDGQLPSGGFGGGNTPERFTPPGQGEDASAGSASFGHRGGSGGGMGSSDVKLQYIDDNPDSYANIFDSAKTDITDADQARLIQSLKVLSQGGDVSEVLDVDQVLRYLVVHNFVVNGDSYTGSMVHNYYLYEEDGRLSMLPWDYNLAFGTFQGGNAAGAVNDPIDAPLSVTGDGDRPMADWVFSSAEYTQRYHQYFEEFLSTVDPAVIIQEAYTLIAPFVEQDPTRFCTYEEFQTGVEALKTFCALRAESVSGQLAGAIPSTSAGQSADSSALVDASALTLSDMGTMNNGGPGGNRGGEAVPAFGAAVPAGADPGGSAPQAPEGGSSDAFPEGGTLPGQRPEDMEAGSFGGGFPGGGPGGQTPGAGTSQIPAALLLLAVSALSLAAGLTIAFKFRR